MTIQWLESWWNLIYVAPFALALLYLGLYTLSGVTFGDPDTDVGGDFDADADVDGDVHLDGDMHVAADAGVEANADLEADGDADSEAACGAESDGDAGGHDAAGVAMAALQWLGLGRVPVSIILMVLLLSWGWFGFVANALLRTHLPGSWIPVISLPFAAACSVMVTRGVVGLVARWLPNCETNARRRHELLGAVGEAMFPIDEKFGMLSVRDTQGDLYQVACRMDEGQPAVPKGRQVKLVAYNAKQGIFRVIPWDAVAR